MAEKFFFVVCSPHFPLSRFSLAIFSTSPSSYSKVSVCNRIFCLPLCLLLWYSLPSVVLLTAFCCDTHCLLLWYSLPSVVILTAFCCDIHCLFFYCVPFFFIELWLHNDNRRVPCRQVRHAFVPKDTASGVSWQQISNLVTKNLQFQRIWIFRRVRKIAKSDY